MSETQGAPMTADEALVLARQREVNRAALAQVNGGVGYRASGPCVPGEVSESR